MSCEFDCLREPILAGYVASLGGEEGAFGVLVEVGEDYGVCTYRLVDRAAVSAEWVVH